jgi:hypothetical protein
VEWSGKDADYTGRITRAFRMKRAMAHKC